MNYPLDYDELEEIGKRRANRLFDLYFEAIKKYPDEAERILVEYAKGRITYEEAIAGFRELLGRNREKR